MLFKSYCSLSRIVSRKDYSYQSLAYNCPPVSFSSISLFPILSLHLLYFVSHSDSCNGTEKKLSNENNTNKRIILTHLIQHCSNKTRSLLFLFLLLLLIVHHSHSIVIEWISMRWIEKIIRNRIAVKNLF
jgi:hypothetical protein